MDKYIRVCDVEHPEELLADERRQFGLDGQAYEVDLCVDDNETFERLLRPYVDAARRVSRTRARSRH